MGTYNFWKPLFIVTYIISGLLVGNSISKEYNKKCWNDQYAASIAATIFWPIVSLVDYEAIKSKCEEDER